MRLTIYIISFLIVGVLFVYGILGNLGAAVSYKFEVEDPIVEMTIEKLPQSERQAAYYQLQERKNQIELQEYFFSGLFILSIVSFSLLIVNRRRILGNRNLHEKEAQIK